MAKSLRSKFKRKVRAIKRTKKEPKTAALLQTTIDKREKYEKEDAEKVMETTDADSANKMETTEKATINTKTLKKADGSYPSWLSGTKKKKAAKKVKAAKQAKKKAPGSFR